VTESSEESAVATVADWPEALATVLTGAVDLARQAIAEFSVPDAVGEYLGASYEDPNAATHRFLAHLPGYQGWQWAVVVATYAGADHATISEVVLVPGPTALLAPEWVPWENRVRPGDLGPGDLLAPVTDDPRLVPGYTASGDDQVDETAAEFGLGRRWVMGAWGRFQAAERWHDGEYGPDSAMSRSTKRVCRDCGFFLPLAGSLGSMFGVCGNELSADGNVVDKQYGCGAHSDTPAPAGTGSPMYEPYDDGVLDVMEKPAIAAPAAEEAAAEEPVAEEAATEAPVAEEAATEVPVAEEPVTEESVAEAPATEESATEEPATEAPATEEPAADESAQPSD
jgi:Protein of unknown function (DUF3027)